MIVTGPLSLIPRAFFSGAFYENHLKFFTYENFQNYSDCFCFYVVSQ